MSKTSAETIRTGTHLAGLFVAAILGLMLSPLALVYAADVASPAVPAATVITVDTSTDLDSGSITKTCTFTAGIYVAAADGKCTLRRAILEAAARPQADRPITIAFSLAANDPNKDLEVVGTWTLPVDDALPPLKTPTIIDKNGQVTIDGSTQPGGRTNGPKIIIDTNDNSLQVESRNNIIRHLAFKGGGAIFLKEDGNLVEEIWMGLSDDGQSIDFRTPGNEMRMAGGGVFISADDNIVQDNVIAGAFARAVDINSGNSNNIIRRNRIGTRADGTAPNIAAPAECLRSLTYDPQNWYGGWGIAVSGSNNQVLENRIAGLHILQSANDTPPMAIEIFGANHLIQDNVIGIDSAGADIGVCGQGIKVSGNGTRIHDNEIWGSRAGFEDDEEAVILASDSSPTFGQISVRRNLTENGPGNIYEFGPGVPQLLRNYLPAKITQINGTVVSGANGDGSPCPGCKIDFYSDDGDAIAETLAYLGETTADSNGNFSFNMAQPLAPGFGIRTASTTQSAGVIGSYLAGTTTQFSKLYLPMSSVLIDGPANGALGSTYTFTVTVAPASATTPISYTLGATGYNAGTVVRDAHVITVDLDWTTAGVKTLSVTAENELGTQSDTHQITIAGDASGSAKIFLPLMSR